MANHPNRSKYAENPTTVKARDRFDEGMTKYEIAAYSKGIGIRQTIPGLAQSDVFLTFADVERLYRFAKKHQPLDDGWHTNLRVRRFTDE